MPALEEAWRDEWGRLLALLVAQYRRLDLAEDGLGDAVRGRGPHLAGATASPTTRPRGCSPRPGAGSSTGSAPRRSPPASCRCSPSRPSSQEEAQRVMADAGRPVARRAAAAGALCAHPALPPESAAALTLRLVMGVADRGHRAAVPGADADDGRPADPGPQAAGRRELRAARRRRPRRVAWRWRADVAYLAFTAGYAPGSGPDVLRADVAAEAIRLARVLREVLPDAAPSSTRCSP